MPDISKCRNSQCPLKEKCYRWTSPPSEYRQSYVNFQFKVDEKGNVVCESLMKRQ